MKAPRAVVVVEGVVVATDELDPPARVAQQQEDHVADGGGLVFAPVGDDGVDDDVALGLPWLHSRVGLAESLVAVVRAQARHLNLPVGAEGGDDIFGPAVVQGVGVGADRGPNPFDDLRVAVHSQKPRSTIGISSGLTLSTRSAGSSFSCGKPA